MSDRGGSSPDVDVRSVSWRPTRGAVTTGAGVAAVALATVLPWRSIPGAELARAQLMLRGETIPATGSVWSALPLTSVILAGFGLTAALLAVLAASEHRLRVPLARTTGACGFLVVVLLVDRLFVEQPAKDVTAVGAGGYLGLIGVVTVTAGAWLVVRDRRALATSAVSPRPIEAGRPEAPRQPAARASAWSAAGAMALVAIYLATRLSFAARFPYFLDEALWANHADQADHSATKLFVSLEFGHGPLLTWLSLAWIKVGFVPLTSVRLVSVTAGLLTVGVVGLLGRSLFGATVGWVAAALCVVLPFYVVHDGIGIYEPLVTLITASALALQIAHARQPRLRVAALLGVVLAAGILTKLNTLPALALLPVSLLCFDWSDPGRRRRLIRWLQGAGIAIVMVGLADQVQRSSSYYARLEEARQSILLWPARSVTSVLDDPFGVSGLNWDTYRPALLGYVTAPLLATALAGAVLAWRKRPRLLGVLLAWLVVPFAIAMLFELRPFPRHVMYVTPPLVVLSAYALVQAAQLARHRLTPRMAAVVCAVGAALALAPALLLDARVLAHPATARYPGLDYWQYVTGWPAGGPWPGAADAIRRQGTGDEVVILAPGSYGILRQILAPDPRYVLVDARSPLAARSQLAVFDTTPFPVDPRGFRTELARRGFVVSGRFSRPNESCRGPRKSHCGGSVIVLRR